MPNHQLQLTGDARPRKMNNGFVGLKSVTGSSLGGLQLSPLRYVMSNENVLIIPVPSLVATLLDRERAKGSPLTRSEVVNIRDECPCIAMTLDQLKQVEERRGYPDIDPEWAWEHWQEVRQDFEDLREMA